MNYTIYRRVGDNRWEHIGQTRYFEDAKSILANWMDESWKET